MTPGEEPTERADQARPVSAVAAPLAGGTDPETTTRSALTGRARTWATATPYRLPTAIAVVGLVLSAPFGGWRTAPSEATPVVPAEQVAEAAPFEVTLDRAYFAARPSESFSELDPGQQYVVVLGTVTSRHDTSVDAPTLQAAITVLDLPQPVDALGAALEGAAPVPEIYSAADSTQLRRLGPDLTYEVGLVFRTAAAELPDELTLQVSGHTWRPDAFTREERWLDPAVAAEIVVPLAPQDTSGGES